jgi:hypothetical protein
MTPGCRFQVVLLSTPWSPGGGIISGGAPGNLFSIFAFSASSSFKTSFQCPLRHESFSPHWLPDAPALSSGLCQVFPGLCQVCSAVSLSRSGLLLACAPSTGSGPPSLGFGHLCLAYSRCSANIDFFLSAPIDVGSAHVASAARVWV